MQTLAIHRRIWRPGFLPGVWLPWAAVGAAILTAIWASDVQAGVMTGVARVASTDAIGAPVDDMLSTSHRSSRASGELPPANILWRFWAGAGRACDCGAGAPSATSNLAGASQASGALWTTLADFQLRAPQSGLVVEASGIIAPRMLTAPPFHPPRNGG